MRGTRVHVDVAGHRQEPFIDPRTAITAAMRDSLDYLPDCPFRDFYAWVLSEPRCQQRWLQLLGIEGLIRLSGALLNGLMDAEESDRLTVYSAPLLVYLTYEAISDNLAIGLAGPAPGDGSYPARAGLVRAFNDAMLARLDGATAASVRGRVLRWTTAPGQISMFRQSLSETEHRALVAAYAKAHPGADPAAIEFTAAPALIANIESAVTAAQSLAGLRTAGLFREGLARRYAAVTELLTSRGPALEELVALGTDAILVIPTLAYYAGLIAEVVRPMAGYHDLVDDGLLNEALAHAALLVRVLNDCGTGLAEQGAGQRRALISDLHALARSRRSATLSDVLRQAALAHGRLLTRISKDLSFGEFNICLDGIRDLPVSAGAVPAFEHRLHRVCASYQRSQRGLQGATRRMTRRLRTDVISAIVLRFVEFHRLMYADSFTTASGEYAIARS
ncbi:MAG TPA: hypothetical protein VIV12_07175 [Streptosporangiaceae bacterium]